MRAVAVAAALAAAFLLLDPQTQDLAAQGFRADLFGRIGWSAWSNQWYGGHHLPGYSVLAPALGHWLGPPLVGALSVVGAAAAGARVAGPAHRGAAAWWAFGLGAMLFTGRTTFLLGVALGTLAVAARRRPPVAAGAAALAALASPLAGAFVALAGLAQRRPALVVGAALPVGALSLLFPEGGREPFVASAFWPALAASLAVAALVPRRDVRTGALLLAAAQAGLFVLDTPVGGNATRLGPLLAGPLLLALAPRRAAVLALAPLLVYWQLYPAVRDVAQAHGDASTARAYHREVLPLLPRAGRVEVPFTRAHFEARWLALEVPLARGWERQLDVERNAVFYEGTLTRGRYLDWLHENAVAAVALPDAALDPSARAEAALLRGGALGPPVGRTRHWQVYAVPDPVPLGARTAPDRFTTSGPALVRVRWTRWASVLAGRGCVRRDGPWTRTSGAVVVGTSLRPRRCGS